MSDLLSNEALMDVAFAALDHGVDSIEHGGPLIPFVLSETASDRSLQRFVADDLRDAVDRARAVVRAIPADRVALAYEAYVTLGDERSDAVLVEFHERDGAHSGMLAQRLRPGDPTQPLERIGNPAFLGEQDPLR
jgi:hypothetical protein